jgi:hemerythrin-like metal-binding domain
MMQWKDEYAIGMETIDAQHKKLFEIAGRANDLLRQEFVTDKYDAIVDIINELKDYTGYHFKTEEDYMQSIGYKRFLSQKVAHDDFLRKMEEIDFDKIDTDQDKYIIEILDFVTEWLVGHILKQDKLIAANG